MYIRNHAVTSFDAIVENGYWGGFSVCLSKNPLIELGKDADTERLV